jgi:hypothetical protein
MRDEKKMQKPGCLRTLHTKSDEMLEKNGEIRFVRVKFTIVFSVIDVEFKTLELTLKLRLF